MLTVSDKQKEEIIRVNWQEKAPLTCRVCRNPDGSPLKTMVAQKLPLLSRRERRELMRIAIKRQEKLAKVKAASQENS